MSKWKKKIKRHREDICLPVCLLHLPLHNCVMIPEGGEERNTFKQHQIIITHTKTVTCRLGKENAS